MSSYWQPTEYFGLEEKRQNELMHYGTIGMRWGIRKYQNKDGSLTELGRQRYLNLDDKVDYNVNRGTGSNRQKEAVAKVGKRFSQKMYNTIISDKYERALDRKLNKKLGRYPYGTDDRDNNGLISDKYAAKAREELRSKSEEQLRYEKLKNTKTQEDKYDLEASDRKGDNLEEAQYHFLKERYENNPNRKQNLPLDSKEVQYKYQYRMAKEAYKFIHSKYARRDVDYVIEDYPVEKEIKSTGEKYIANYYNLKLTDIGVQNLEKITRANPNDRIWVEPFNKDVELSRKTAKIRQMANNGLTYSEIADRLGVSKSTIADVLK